MVIWAWKKTYLTDRLYLEIMENTERKKLNNLLKKEPDDEWKEMVTEALNKSAA